MDYTMDTLSTEDMPMCGNGYAAVESSSRGVSDDRGRVCVLGNEEHNQNRSSLPRVSSTLAAQNRYSERARNVSTVLDTGFETEPVMTQDMLQMRGDLGPQDGSCFYENRKGLHRQMASGRQLSYSFGGEAPEGANAIHKDCWEAPPLYPGSYARPANTMGFRKRDKLVTPPVPMKKQNVSHFLPGTMQIKDEYRPDISLESVSKYGRTTHNKNLLARESVHLKNSSHSQSLLPDLQFAAMSFQGALQFSEVPEPWNLLSQEAFLRQPGPYATNLDMVDASARGSSELIPGTGSDDCAGMNGFSVPSFDGSSGFSQKVESSIAAVDNLSVQERSAAAFLEASARRLKPARLEGKLKGQQMYPDNKPQSVTASERYGGEATILVEASDDFLRKINSTSDGVSNESKDDAEKVKANDKGKESSDDTDIGDGCEERTEQPSGAPSDSGKIILLTKEAAALSDPPVEISRKFQCKVCKKSWKSKRGLNKHMRTHIKKFTCSVCNSRFSSKYHLKRHLLTHAHGKSKSSLDQSTTNQSFISVKRDHSIVRAFSCSMCLYRAKQKKDLTKHMLVHTAAKVHKCQLCKFSSKRKYSLHRHMKTVHSTARVYECNVCDFKVSVLDSFKKHMATHSVARTTSCIVCGTVIKDRASLIEHLLSHSTSQKSTCKKCEEISFTGQEYMQHLLTHKDPSSIGFEETYQAFGVGTSFSISAASKSSLSGFLSHESNAGLDAPTTEAKISQMSTMVSRLSDLTKASTSLSDKSKFAFQLVEISALASELSMISENILQSYSCDLTGGATSGKTKVLSVSREFTEDSSFADDEFGLSSLLDIDASDIKEEYQDKIYSSVDTDMQIQVDFNGEAVSCIQKGDLGKQRGGSGSDHKREKHLKCALCNLVFADTSTLKRHLMVHIDSRPYACEKCGQTFRRKEHMKKHMVIHSTERPYVCKECHYGAKTEDRLRIHMSCHSQNKEHACQFCSFSGRTSYDLNQHMKRHKPQTCTQCSWVCYSRAEYKKHIFTHSTFDCGECSFTTTDKTEYSRHAKKHSLTQHLCCELCGYSCDTMRKFKYHKLRHENKTPFVCPDCDYKCSSRASYDCHRLKHAGLKPYLCSFCGSSFIKTSHLNQHMLIHKDEKAFRCHVCGYCCRTKHNLKEHEMTHSGEKPYGCKYCSFSSRRKKALLLHMLKHESS